MTSGMTNPPRVPDDVREMLTEYWHIGYVEGGRDADPEATNEDRADAERRRRTIRAALDARLAALAEDAARLREDVRQLVADAERVREALTAADVLKVTRFEVIDYRRDAPDPGRTFQAHGCSVTLSVQDEGRTLKVFVDSRAARATEGTER